MSLDPLGDDGFTIAILPDTQEYAARNPEGFHAMTRWVAGNREPQRIVFCSHVGDVVRHHDRAGEWIVADGAMSRLEGRVPYGISVGNNDMDEGTGEAPLFCKTFPAQRYAGLPWYGGSSRGNADSWQTFEAAGQRYLVLHLECNAPDEVLEWADAVIAAHADHRVMITTHMFLGPLDKPRSKDEFFTGVRGVARWSKCHGGRGNSPADLWDKCISRHRNVFLIACGDQSRVQAMSAELAGRDGNRVLVSLSDYYGAPEGWLRLHRIRPARGQMEVITYGAISETVCTGTTLVPDARAHRFDWVLDD